MPATQPAEDLPNRLRYWRNRAGLTLAEACHPIGISHVHLQRLETGTRELTMPVMERAAEFYGCSVADLLLPAQGGLTHEERYIIDTFRTVPEHARRSLSAIAESQQPFRHGPEVVPLDRTDRNAG